MYLFIGSCAMDAYGLLPRVPRDVDIIADYDSAVKYIKKHGNVLSCLPVKQGTKLIATYKNDCPVEAEIAWPGSSAEDILNIYKEPASADLDLLYMLKMSHRYLKDSPHFLKTMNDIHLLRKAGAKIRAELAPIYIKRMDETYKYNHPKLNVTRKEFFKDDGIQYVVDHDFIHENVKLFSKPIYQMIAVPGQEVLSSKEKFEHELSDQERLAAVWEESCVLAIERSLIPHPGVLTPVQAFEKALEKVCTSITSGWFREFAWEHYYEVRNIMPDDALTNWLNDSLKECYGK